MKRAAVLLAMLLAVPAVACAAPRPPSALIPQGAHVEASRGIAGYRHARVLLYRASRRFVAVRLRGRLLWARALPPGAATIRSPGPSGLFVVELSALPAQTVYAYRLTHGHVYSALSGVASAGVAGSEGITWSGNAFETRNPDTGHVGSVRYRKVEHFALCGHDYCPSVQTLEPDYPVAQYPSPNGVVHTRDGSTTLVRLEVAADEQSREHGLMGRTSLDPDSGMVFVWPGLVLESFWMQDTYIPLTVAFLSPDGTVEQMMDMAPLNDSILYTPDRAYQYAIEVNQGFFAAHDIQVGDRVELTLNS